MAIIPPTRRLKPGENYSLLTLDKYAPGTYTSPFLVDGSTVVSNIFIQEIPPGATVEVSYYDYTYTGIVTEYLLAEHLPLTLIGNNRIPINLIRNSPEVRVKVTGGVVQFSINVVVLQSFVSEVDANLREENEEWVLGQMGQPVMGLDPSDGKYKFVKIINGVMQVSLASDSGVLDTSILGGNVKIGTTAVPLHVGATKMTDRKVLIIQPRNGTIYIGPAGVTTANGIEVIKKQIARISTDVAWYGISATPLVPSGGITSSLVEGK